jgi:hypothetical protein
LLFGVLVVFVVACGNDDVDTSELPTRVDCTGATPGAACDAEGEWCATTNICGEDVSYCRCTDGHYSCSDPYTPAEIQGCDVISEASCFLEGTGVCDFPPYGSGRCDCTDGAWSCSTSCDGCPLTVPADGDACTVSGCLYAAPQATSCACNGGVFDCEPI